MKNSSSSNNPTPDSVWAILQELSERFVESAKKTEKLEQLIQELSENADRRHAEAVAEADRRHAEADRRSAEADRRHAEAVAETEELKRLVKEQSKMISGISDSNGKFAEEMIFNSLEKDMIFAGIKFGWMDTMKRSSKALNLRGQYDAVMINGDTLAIIEIKYKVDKDDVIKLYTKQVSDFKKLYPEYGNYKMLLGIGGLSFEDKSEDEAQENGIGIIKVVGDKVEYFTDDIKEY